MVRPLAPANIGRWAAAIETDLDGAARMASLASQSAETAQQGVGAVFDALGRVTSKDTAGWVALSMTLSVGWSLQSPDTLDYRVLNGCVYFSGRLNATAGAGQSVFTAALPPSIWPSRSMILAVTTTGAVATFSVVMGTDGMLTVFKGGNAVSNLPLTAIPGIPLS